MLDRKVWPVAIALLQKVRTLEAKAKQLRNLRPLQLMLSVKPTALLFRLLSRMTGMKNQEVLEILKVLRLQPVKAQSDTVTASTPPAPKRERQRRRMIRGIA